MSISVETLAISKKYTDEHGGGTVGTMNYTDLINKPRINGVELVGDKTTAELGIKDGQTPNITIGTVETLPAGSSVTASITGATPNLVFNLGIPQGQNGDPGQAATIEIAETETVSSDTPAAMVELPGSTPQARLYKAQVPQGPQGPAGAGIPPTDTAQTGDVPTWDGENVVWKAQSGGGSLWTLMAKHTTEEPISEYRVDLSKPCTELIAYVENAKISDDSPNSSLTCFANGAYTGSNTIKKGAGQNFVLRLTATPGFTNSDCFNHTTYQIGSANSGVNNCVVSGNADGVFNAFTLGIQYGSINSFDSGMKITVFGR